MSPQDKPLANSLLVLREEFDDWAILFDPDTGNSFGLNPVSAFIFRHLDGKHTIADITTKLKQECTDAPENASGEVEKFVEDLMQRGYAGLELSAS